MRSDRVRGQGSGLFAVFPVHVPPSQYLSLAGESGSSYQAGMRAGWGVVARPAHRVHAPLMAVAERVDAMRSMRGVRPSDVVVTAVGWGETEALQPRVALRASSSYTAGDGVGLRREWIPEPNTYDRAGLRAVVAAFLLENDPTVVSEADGRFQATRRRIEGIDGVDVDAGIAAMENYLDGQRSTGLED
jgi:hypothetical protein